MTEPHEPSPFAVFGERARRTLFFARLAVTRLGGSEVAETHLLHGVLADSPTAVTRFAAGSEWTASRLLQLVGDLATREPGPSVSVEVPFSPAVLRIFPVAAARALGANRELVPEDLVLGLLEDPAAPVARLLAEAGVTREAVEAWLRAS